MSSVTQRPGSPDPPNAPVEVFPYGWRYVPKKLPDGTTDLVRIPLTLEDVLHPQYGDVMPESTLHARVRNYLGDVCHARTDGDPTALVISDVLIYWDDPTLNQHSPDIGVIFGVRNRDAPRKSFRVAQEQTRPRVIIEIVSPDTRSNDVDNKLVAYHQARVPYYIILDRAREDDPWQLRGYRYAPGQYEEMTKDEHGRP